MTRPDTTEHQRAASAAEESATHYDALSEQGFRTLAEAMPQIVWATLPDGANVYFNQRWVEYTGLSLAESYGSGWSTPFHPEDKQRSEEAWQSATSTGGIYELEVRLRRADGVYRWWLIRGVPHRDATGEIDKWFGTCTDIEDMKRQEKQLVDMLGSMTEGLALHEIILDESGSPCDYRYLDVNPAFEEMAGLKGVDIIGRRVLEVLPDIEPSWIKDYGTVAQTGVATRFERYTSKLDRHFEIVAYSPQAGQFATLVSDITERKLAEAALSEGEQRYRTLFDTMSEGVVYEDADGTITSANPAAERLLGLSLDQMQGRTSLDPRWRAVHEDGSPWPGETHPIPAALKTGKPTTDEVQGVYNPQSGEYVWLSVNAIPEFLPGETLPFRAYAVFRDITERKHGEDELLRLNENLERRVQERTEEYESANQELIEVNRQLGAANSELGTANRELSSANALLDEASRVKSAFLSNMSHELRTPLNSVIALSGVLGRKLAGTIPDDEYSYLEVIERNGKNLLHLINDILDLSRIEAGKEELNIGRFSVADTIAEILDMVRPQAEEEGISLLRQLEDELPPITSDSTKVQHILQNLISNAVKFTEQGAVTVSATREGHDVLIAVTDTGIGIAGDQLPHIFDEFRQADDSTSRKYGGTGLGLAIAREYAHLLSGDITVRSTLGEGSTFTLRIPVTLDLPMFEPDAGEIRTSRTSRGPAAVAGLGECILLVEDSEPAIVQVTDVLTTHGYRVQVARNGREALDQIEQQVPDAMILDLMMPEVDGFEVLDSIRSKAQTAHLPVLILTAKHVSKAELSFLTENGIHELIQKGDIDVPGLLSAVANMVGVEHEPAPFPSVAHEPIQASSGKPVALVVEDNPDNRFTARALLAENYEVIEAENGQVGVELARLHKPDVILMDVVMPVMDGVQALAELRGDEATRDIPVIVVTASAMRGDRETMLGHGFDGYVSKPIDEELLRQVLREILEEK